MGEKRMKILLTGGSGFIGCQLAQAATRLGHRVTVTAALNNDVERERCEVLRQAGIAVVPVRLEETAKLARALENQDAVIHLAAAQHEAREPESYFHAINVAGTRNLIELAIQAGVRRFVHGSTIGVYGGASGSGVLDETSALAPDNAYGRTKAQAEAVVREYAGRIETCIVRISETYGVGDMRLLKLFRAIAHGRYFTLGDGQNAHQLIYVDDLVQGLLAAASAPAAAGATIVLAGAQTVTTDEMVIAIRRALGKADCDAGLHLPLWPFDIAAFLMEKILSPLGIEPPLHRRRLDFFRKSFRFSTATAERLLGIRAATSFADGARLTGEWYRRSGLLDGDPNPEPSPPPQPSC
jgi:dihydroflavonol-4-reductase